MAGKKKPSRRYSDEERATALAVLHANDGSVPLTAEQLGIPEHTLRKWANGTRHPEATQLGNEKKRPLAEVLLDTVRRMLGGLTDAKIKKANVKDTFVAIGIGVEKYLLLIGEPTDIRKSVSDLSDDDLNREIQERERTLRLESGEGNPPEAIGAA